MSGWFRNKSNNKANNPKRKPKKQKSVKIAPQYIPHLATIHSNEQQKKTKSRGRGNTIDTASRLSGKKVNDSTDKICVGDKIIFSNEKCVNCKGTVMYIGYPFGRQFGVRYGINLTSEAKGDHNGSLYIDIKTGKMAKKSHMKKYSKRIKKRRFFKTKKKHGIFVKKRQISAIERKSTLKTRFSIEDNVEVRFRGDGRIQFIGPLEHTKELGVWYGIKLKDRRGRHDGTVNGVKYFECPPQYGLHCRQNHLTLKKVTMKSTQPTKLEKMSTKSRKRLTQPLNGGNRVPNKVRSMLGMKGFAIPQTVKSTNNLLENDENMKLEHIKSLNEMQSSTSISRPLFRLTSRVNAQQSQPPDPMAMRASLSNILPMGGAFRQAVSIHVSQKNLLNSTKRKSKTVLSESSYQSGMTTVVLPNYQQKFKQKKFTDYYDFDEIEDELGEGEFGVVYKCRKVDIEELDEDTHTETTYATTMCDTSMDEDSVSGSDSVTYPGDSSGDDYPGDDYDDDHDLAAKTFENTEIKSEQFAVKKIKKAKFHHLGHRLKQDNIKMLQDEIKLLEKMQRLKQRKMDGSQYVIDLIDVFEDRNYLYIVTNFCGGGNLWSYIENESEKDSLTLQKIQEIMKQILEGLAFLHEHNLAHLDLKPDNIMFNDKGQIQLIDFGMSRVIPSLHKKKVLVGSPNFVAPEVIEGFYDKKADIWSVGVIFFMLRFGYPPFYEGNSGTTNTESFDGKNGSDQSKNFKQLFEDIKAGFDPVVKDGLGAHFPSSIPICDELKDLISKMLQTKTDKRFTANECLDHPYFGKLANEKKLPQTVMSAMTKFSGQCRFKVLISRLFAHQIEPEQVKQLKEIWNKFDKNGDGSLNMEQFKCVMNEYEHGYREDQIEAMFESMDWNDSDSINFNSLLTAFSYQRLVAVDERLWEAFARLDDDNDGHITKAEIKRVLALVNKDAFTDGIKKLTLFKPEKSCSVIPEIESSLSKDMSIFIGDCLIAADWDDDGQIDYEEFLRALHPQFNEDPVTPKALDTALDGLDGIDQDKSFIFQPSLGTAAVMKIGGFGAQPRSTMAQMNEKMYKTLQSVPENGPE